MKAVLVLDEMPTECVECLLCSDGQCDALGIYLENVFNQKDERCPLRPLSEIKYISLNDTHDDLIFQMGWNACLDAIMGETE